MKSWTWWFNNTNERKRQELFFHVLRPTFDFCVCRHSRVVHKSSLMKTISNFFPKFVGWNWRGNIFHHNLGKRTGQNLFQPVSIKNSLRKQPRFGDATTGFPAKWRLRNQRSNSILMTHHYPDLGSASDWSCCVGNLIQSIRSTTQSSVWNFCARFSDAIWRGNQW